MTKLLDLLSIVDEFQDRESLLRAYYADIWKLGEILFQKGLSQKRRKALMRELKQSWERELNELRADYPQDPHCEFFSAACRLTDSQWPGLFHCYAHPNIPGTNNTTEQFIAELKSQERVQAKTPNPAARFIRNAPITAIFNNRPSLPGEELVASASLEQITRAKELQKNLTHRTRIQRWARRDMQKLLDHVAKRWNNSSPDPPTGENMQPSDISTS